MKYLRFFFFALLQIRIPIKFPLMQTARKNLGFLTAKYFDRFHGGVNRLFLPVSVPGNSVLVDEIMYSAAPALNRF